MPALYENIEIEMDESVEDIRRVAKKEAENFFFKDRKNGLDFNFVKL